MENTYNPRYQKLYSQGYTFGQNPIFLDWEDITNVAPRYNNQAFLTGFTLGRSDYEKLNGKVEHGIPDIVLTKKLLSEFHLCGEIGMPIETCGFNSHQLAFIHEAYDNGFKLYEPDRDIELYCELAINGISL